MDVGPGVSAIGGAAGVNASFDVAVEGWYLLFELQVLFTKLSIALGEP